MDSKTILALVQIGADLAPTIIQYFKPPAQKLEPVTLEYLLALGYSLDEANLILAQQMQGQP